MEGGAEGGLWQVRLWQRFCVVSPEGTEYRPASRKSAEMLAYLALRRNSLVQREALAAVLWPETDSSTARNRLKQTLASIRKDIPGLPLHAHGKHEIEFPFTEIRVDVRELAERVRWVSLLSGPARREAVAQLLEATSGTLLDGYDLPWVYAEQEEWRARRQGWEKEVAGGAEGATVFRFTDEFPGVRVDLVGRSEELEAIRHWFEEEQSRSLCLVGAPGVGKTRLMRAFFDASDPPFDALIAVSTSQAFETNWIDRLAEATGAVNRSALVVRVATLLRGFERPLLAVDDMDQASAEVREWIGDLRERVPALRLISTARRSPSERETVIRLTGLSDDFAAELLRIFALRAGVPEKSLGSGPVADLAHRLEGFPLALEVAAGWLSFLSPASLREHLDRSPEILIDQAPASGRSLAQSVEMLTADLSDAEREAILLVAICHGGLGERLAERILGSRWPWLFRRLAERSLIYSVAGQGGPRYAMLQALRETVRHLTPAGEVAELSRRLCVACCDLMRVASYEAYEAHQAEWLDWLHDETDNLLFTLETTLSDPWLLNRAFLGVVRLHAALRHPSSRKRFDELIEKMNREARRHPAEMNDVIRGYFWLVDRLQETARLGFPQTIDLVETAVRDGVGEHGWVDPVSNWETIGNLYYHHGDHEASLRAYARCGELCGCAGLRTRQHWMESFQAHAERRLGLLDECRERKRRARQSAAEMGLFNSVGSYDLELAKELFAAGEFERAVVPGRSAVAAFRQANETWLRSRSLVEVGEILLAAGYPEEAEGYLTEAGELLHPHEEELLERRQRMMVELGSAKAR